MALSFFQPPPRLIPSGLSPPRWAACSNSSNSDSDVNASTTSHPKGQFDLQDTSVAHLQRNLGKLLVFFFIVDVAVACLCQKNAIMFQ